MRVVVISASTNASGGARQAIYQTAGLAQRGHDATLLLPERSPFWKLYEPDPLWRPLPSDASLWRQIVEELLPDGPGIVHAYHGPAIKRVAWWGLSWRRRGIACVAHRGVVARPGNPLPFLSPAMRAFIANSQACARSLCFHCPRHKLHVVHNGIPDARITPGLPPERMRADLDLTGKELVFGYVGNDNPVKGTEVLLRAFAMVRRPDARLIMVGNTPDRWKALLQEPGLQDRVRLAGNVENVSDYLQLCDIFVFPSQRMDSAPNTLLEATRMGLPVVASNVGGVSEHIADNGLLARALEEAAKDPERRSRWSRASLALGQRYTVQARCAALERIYTRVLEEL